MFISMFIYNCTYLKRLQQKHAHFCELMKRSHLYILIAENVQHSKNLREAAAKMRGTIPMHMLVDVC